MKAFLSAACLAVFLSVCVAAVSAEEAAKPKTGDKAGEQLFKKHCEICHPGGGNIINSKKPIGSKSLASRNITTPEQIVKIIRKPPPAMVKFDKKTLSDEDANMIAEFVLSAFN